jgi:disulfide bond formation protein DsbB
MNAQRLASLWPILAALASAAMLAAAHAFETFGGYAPCALCLRQREVYWAALAVAVAGLILMRLGRIPARIVCAVLGLVFLVGCGVAAYHAGVEWKWWPGPTTCSGAGSLTVTGDLSALLEGKRVRPPACDEAAWRLLGLSMAGYNALISAGLAVASFVLTPDLFAKGGDRRGA